MSTSYRYVCHVHWRGERDVSPTLARRVTIDIPEDFHSSHEPERTMSVMVEGMGRHALRTGTYTWVAISSDRRLG